ncbi:MAG: NAD(P)/FAD-dependent oxidoreductase [Anaerolineae bacterium]
MNIGIVGAGAAGLTAAYELTKRGHAVTVYEAAEAPGGLASGFKAPHWDWHLERFYHHWFTSDHEVVGLIRELGLEDRLFWPRPITSVWHQGGIYPFDSPLAVLRFPGLPLLDKLRMGLVTLYLRLTRNWQPLESVTAHEWLPRWMGRRAYQVVWEPFFIGKFGEHYQEVNMAWFWARIYKRSPKLGYFVGGFQALFDALAERVRGQGGTIHLGTPVQAIVPDPEGGLRVRTAQGEARFDAVIATVSPRLMARLAPDLPADYLSRLGALRSLGALTLILALDRPLTHGFYWINLPAGEFPFLALVEHTHYIPPEHYGNDHLIYLGHYLPPDHRYFGMTKEELLAEFLPPLRRFNPEFDPGWVRESWLFREEYAQPVVPLNYSQMIPSIKTPIPGLYFASMSQVYPWDRGTNYAVELGKKVAKMVVEEKR